MARECVTHHMCDCTAERLALLDAENKRLAAALERAERRNQINMDAYANVTQQMVEQRQARQAAEQTLEDVRQCLFAQLESEQRQRIAAEAQREQAEYLLQRNLDAMDGERARWRDIDGHRLQQVEAATARTERLTTTLAEIVSIDIGPCDPAWGELCTNCAACIARQALAEGQE